MIVMNEWLYSNTEFGQPDMVEACTVHVSPVDTMTPLHDRSNMLLDSPFIALLNDFLARCNHYPVRTVLAAKLTGISTSAAHFTASTATAMAVSVVTRNPEWTPHHSPTTSPPLSRSSSSRPSGSFST